MAHDVFISYSHVDKATADAACAMLERNGIRCWIAPRDITPGDEWSAAIIKAIDQCRVMLLIFSARANDSRQIRREVERAITAGVTLVPVRIENVNPTESLAYFMSTVHWLDAMTPPLDSHLQRLADSVKALLQAGGHAPSTSGAHAAQGVMPATAVEPPKTGMFAEPLNFSFQRRPLQAVGWYLIYFVIGISVAIVIGRGVDFFVPDKQQAFAIGLIAGQMWIIPYHIAIGILLLMHRVKDATNLLLLIGGVLLSVALGALGGLIPLSIMTCRKAAKA